MQKLQEQNEKARWSLLISSRDIPPAVHARANGEAADVPPVARRVARAGARHAAPQGQEDAAASQTSGARRTSATVPRRHHDAQEHHCDDGKAAGRTIAAAEWTRATEHYRDVHAADHEDDDDDGGGGQRACCCEATSVDSTNHSSSSSKDSDACADIGSCITRACTNTS